MFLSRPVYLVYLVNHTQWDSLVGMLMRSLSAIHANCFDWYISYSVSCRDNITEWWLVTHSLYLPYISLRTNYICVTHKPPLPSQGIPNTAFTKWSVTLQKDVALWQSSTPWCKSWCFMCPECNEYYEPCMRTSILKDMYCKRTCNLYTAMLLLQLTV
jgi:hypothetical protein